MLKSSFIVYQTKASTASCLTILIAIILLSFKDFEKKHKRNKAEKRPNILFVISDDQSFPHASAYGYKAIITPAFDRVAKEGVLFNNAFAASPGCSPSRAALLTGKNCWQIEEGCDTRQQFFNKV
jgi:uncharacterized sulfatase